MKDEESDFPTWKKESAAERYRRCIAVLYINGLLSQAERDKVHQRLAERDLQGERQ